LLQSTIYGPGNSDERSGRKENEISIGKNQAPQACVLVTSPRPGATQNNRLVLPALEDGDLILSGGWQPRAAAAHHRESAQEQRETAGR
jgi:hypothetical protein